MTQTRILRCPACGGTIDPALNIEGRDEPRDWTPCQCHHCGAISTFDHTAPGGVRSTQSADWEEWRKDPTLSVRLDVALRVEKRMKETT